MCLTYLISYSFCFIYCYANFFLHKKVTEMLEEKVRKAIKRVDAEKSAKAIGAFTRRIRFVETKKGKYK